MTRSFIRRTTSFVAAVAVATLTTRSAGAQAKALGAPGGFGVGYTDVGPALGLGGLGGANMSFGGRLEHGLKSLPRMGNGTLGIEASFDYYSWSAPSYSWKYIPFGVTANYHFKLDDPKIDPFVGAGLGYQIITCDYAGVGSNLCSNSAVYFIGRLGARYFFAPKMAAYADVGAGAATLNVGLMFRMH